MLKASTLEMCSTIASKANGYVTCLILTIVSDSKETILLPML